MTRSWFISIAVHLAPKLQSTASTNKNRQLDRFNDHLQSFKMSGFAHQRDGITKTKPQKQLMYIKYMHYI